MSDSGVGLDTGSLPKSGSSHHVQSVARVDSNSDTDTCCVNNSVLPASSSSSSRRRQRGSDSSDENSDFKSPKQRYSGFHKTKHLSKVGVRGCEKSNTLSLDLIYVFC